MDAVIQRLHEMFPLLARISVRDKGSRHLDALPPYLGLILSVLSRPSDRPLCFIFPRRGEIPRLAAIAYCLTKLAAGRQATTSTDLSSFNTGDRVLVHPSREVFVFLGPHELPGYFKLGELDRNPSLHFAMPITALSRLERTTRQRPKGDIGRSAHIRKPPAAPIDVLLGTSTFGNLGSIANEVLLLDSKTGFKALVDELLLHAPGGTGEIPPLKQILPFGSVDFNAAGRPVLEKFDDTSGSGEPVLAVTSSAELLAHYCIEPPVRRRVIVVNGLKHIRDLQSYDDLAQHHRLVLFADHDDEEMMHALGARGCKFWPLETEELLAGANGAAQTSLIGSVTRWARNAHAMSIDDEPCEDARIDELFLRLDSVRNQVSSDDEGPAARLISFAWGMFSRVRAALQPVPADQRARNLTEIEAFRTDLRRYSAWLNPEIITLLAGVADQFAAFFGEGSQLGTAKGVALQQVIIQSMADGQRIAILTKDENKVVEVRQWLYDRALPASLPVYSVRRFPDAEVYDRLVCVSWPNGDAMQQIAAKLAAPRITLVGYACERMWLKRSQPRLRWRPDVGGITRQDKAAFLAAPGAKFSWEARPPAPPPADTTKLDPEIWGFERRLRGLRVGLAARPTDALETIPAKYVRFAGEYYCFLTETHRVPIATDLVSGSARAGQKLPERTVEEIRPGDFVVFPESGDHELLHELADKILGREAGKLRKRAHAWKDALNASGQTPDEFHRTACELAMRRHPATIRHWFADSSQIGPRLKDDLVLIGLVTANRDFEANIEDTWQAIETLRSAHLSAGMRLRDVLLNRLPAMMGHIEENGTLIDLAELGSARVVQVEAVAADHESRGRSEVNRLLSEHAGDLFGELL